MKKKLLLITSLTVNIAFGQTDSTAESNGKFTFSGYVDVNYFHNMNNPQNGTNLGASGFERAFDQKAEQFQIGLVQTKINYTHKKSEAVVDLVFGPHADLGNYGNTVGPLGGTTSLAIKQAYFNYKATKKLTFTAGQFGTHIGYEVIDAPLNFHYSLNNLFNNGPFYHIGAKLTYAMNDKLSIMGGVVNNWDNLYDNNQFKTAIAQIAYAVNDNTKLYLNYIGGDETTQANFNSGDTLNVVKQMIDFVGTFQITPKFNVGFNGVIGQLGYNDTANVRMAKNWGGAALYLNYKFKPKFTLGARVDFLDNTQGVQYIGKTDVVSGTLTGLITAADGHLLIKPEIRMDQYKVNEGNNNQQFMDANGDYTKSSQMTVGIAFVYKY
jgi:hypothetical protein